MDVHSAEKFRHRCICIFTSISNVDVSPNLINLGDYNIYFFIRFWEDRVYCTYRRFGVLWVVRRRTKRGIKNAAVIVRLLHMFPRFSGAVSSCHTRHTAVQTLFGVVTGRRAMGEFPSRHIDRLGAPTTGDGAYSETVNNIVVSCFTLYGRWHTNSVAALDYT